MAQNVQRRSQPEASFSEATGDVSSRLRRRPSAAGRQPGVAGHGDVGDRAGALRRADRQQGAPVARDVRLDRAAGDDVVQPVGDVGVVVEAEHGVGLGQRLGQLAAVPLGQAADGHDLGAGVGRGQHRVDGVLLGRVDEAAGVDDQDVGVVLVVGQRPARAGQPSGQLLGVDLVARASQRDHRDVLVRRGEGSEGTRRRLPARA